MKEDPKTEQIVLSLNKHEFRRFSDIAKHFGRKIEDVILILANKNFYILEERESLKTNRFQDTAPGEEGRREKNEQILLDVQQDILDVKKILLANNAYMYSSASKKLDEILEKLRSLR